MKEIFCMLALFALATVVNANVQLTDEMWASYHNFGYVPIDDKTAQEMKLWVSVNDNGKLEYVGGLVDGFTISGFSPFVPTGMHPEYAVKQYVEGYGNYCISNGDC